MTDITSKIKGPVLSHSDPVQPTEVVSTAVKEGSSVSSSDVKAAQVIRNAAKDIVGYRPSLLASGAFKIFDDGIIFPPNLLDVNNPENNPKYFRMLAAVFGLEDYERYFYTGNEKDEERKRVKRDLREKREKEGQSEEDPSEEDS